MTAGSSPPPCARSSNSAGTSPTGGQRTSGRSTATTDRHGLAVLHANLGALEAWSGEHRAAMDHFAAVLALAPDHPALTAAIHNSMAMRCHLAGDDRAAVEHARLALDVEGVSDRLRAGAWCNLALASARLGEHDDALLWHHRAVELAERSGEPSVRVHTYLGLGETLLRLGRPAAGVVRTQPRALARAGHPHPGGDRPRRAGPRHGRPRRVAGRGGDLRRARAGAGGDRAPASR